MGQFVAHEPCPKCGSKDALARYADGTGNCFSCQRYFRAEGSEKVAEDTDGDTKRTHDFLKGEPQDLTERKITEDTCRLWGYWIGTNSKGKRVHIANYRGANGAIVAQKIRGANKEFSVVGNGKDMPLYGQHLWSGGRGGKSVVITEGEIDALSMSQAHDNKWAVVSLPNGAQSAEKVLGQALEWLDQFEHIVLCFDMDKPGREAVEAATTVLPVGKVKVMNLPEKDANAVLIKHGPGALVQAFWNSQPWRPDGIVHGSTLTRDRLKQAVAKGIPYGLPLLDEMTFGLRKGELTLLTAASGIGKSTWAREIAYAAHQQHGCRIGNVFLEENNAKSGQAYVAIHTNTPLKLIRRDPTVLTDEQWDRALAEVVHKNMWFYDHFGSLSSDNLMKKLRFLATVEKVDFIILDHISIVVSGMDSDEGERKDIDKLMTRLRSLIEETGVGVVAIVHVKRTGKNLNEGAEIALTDLRGSASLEQLSDNVFALERDQQGDAPTLAKSRVLKCRETGETGEADKLNYDRETGRLGLASGFEASTETDTPEEF